MKKFSCVLVLVILCLSSVSMFAILANAQQSSSWPMFHADASHTGYTNGSWPTTNQTCGLSKQTKASGLLQQLPTVSSMLVRLTIIFMQ